MPSYVSRALFRGQRGVLAESRALPRGVRRARVCVQGIVSWVARSPRGVLAESGVLPRGVRHAHLCVQAIGLRAESLPTLS